MCSSDLDRGWVNRITRYGREITLILCGIQLAQTMYHVYLEHGVFNWEPLSVRLLMCSQVGAMADRALRPEEPARDVFDLEKDDRWQARLAEARARRAIALREKANSQEATKRRLKPCR